MGFLEKQTDPTSPMHWRGDMQADYFYPSGIAGDKFFKHLMKNDTFLACKCIKCHKVYCPPRLYCEDCFEEISESNWFEVPLTGTVRLFTVATINAHGKKMQEPKLMALIDVDQTDGALLGIIKTNDFNKNFSNTKVKAILRPKGEREGTLKDILYFELI
ncbi:MAG: Zn-ribbon domain-containing OB-fold protein [Candidatus Hodarchaeota archaeon]